MTDIRRNFLSFINKQFIPFLIVFLFLIFLSNIFPKSFFNENREFQLLEIIQNILLTCSLVLLLKFRKQFVKVSNLFTYLLRQLFILFILYEELSFLTYKSNNVFNYQQEFNLHNSNLFSSELFLTIPIIKSTLTPTIGELLFVLILFIFGYGSYFLCFKKIKYLFLDKQFAIYSFMFFFNLLFSKIMIVLNITYFFHISQINGEVIELFIYFLFFIDTLKKKKIMSKANSF